MVTGEHMFLESDLITPVNQDSLPREVLRERAKTTLTKIRSKSPEVIGGVLFGSCVAPKDQQRNPNDIDAYIFLNEDMLRDKLRRTSGVWDDDTLSEVVKEQRLAYYARQQTHVIDAFNRGVGYPSSVFLRFISEEAINKLLTARPTAKAGEIDPEDITSVFLYDVCGGLEETRRKIVTGLKARGEDGEIIWGTLLRSNTAWSKQTIPENLAEAEHQYSQ